LGDKAALLYTGHQFKVRNDYQIDNTNNSDYLLFFHTITKLTGMIVCGIRKKARPDSRPGGCEENLNGWR